MGRHQNSCPIIQYKMKEEEMIEAPKDWVPENDNLKIEGEE